jgi:replicative DNA helicase
LDGVEGPVFVAELSEQVGYAANAEYYASLVRDKAILRRLLDASQQIAGGCPSPVENVADFLNEAEIKLFQVIANQKTQAQSLADLIPVEEARIGALQDRKNQLIGLSTGFKDIGRLTAGLQTLRWSAPADGSGPVLPLSGDAGAGHGGCLARAPFVTYSPTT